jgi:branched-chain amino acid transport system ATP-binding protein
VSLSVAGGELRGIIGPNGAGKSTLFNLISGHLRPDRGTVSYRGVHLERRSAHRRAQDGIGIVFQGARIFRGMTALENVMVGAHAHTRYGFVAGALRLPGQRREEREIRRRAAAELDRVGLAA